MPRRSMWLGIAATQTVACLVWPTSEMVTVVPILSSERAATHARRLAHTHDRPIMVIPIHRRMSLAGRTASGAWGSRVSHTPLSLPLDWVLAASPLQSVHVPVTPKAAHTLPRRIT